MLLDTNLSRRLFVEYQWYKSHLRELDMLKIVSLLIAILESLKVVSLSLRELSLFL